MRLILQRQGQVELRVLVRARRPADRLGAIDETSMRPSQAQLGRTSQAVRIRMPGGFRVGGGSRGNREILGTRSMGRTETPGVPRAVVATGNLNGLCQSAEFVFDNAATGTPAPAAWRSA